MACPLHDCPLRLADLEHARLFSHVQDKEPSSAAAAAAAAAAARESAWTLAVWRPDLPDGFVFFGDVAVSQAGAPVRPVAIAKGEAFAVGYVHEQVFCFSDGPGLRAPRGYSLAARITVVKETTVITPQPRAPASAASSSTDAKASASSNTAEADKDKPKDVDANATTTPRKEAKDAKDGKENKHSDDSKAAESKADGKTASGDKPSDIAAAATKSDTAASTVATADNAAPPMIVKRTETNSVYFWLPLAPEGFTALGCVATLDAKQPSLPHMRCVDSRSVAARHFPVALS
mgnify:CR=1 FL=1